MLLNTVYVSALVATARVLEGLRWAAKLIQGYGRQPCRLARARSYL